MDEERGSVRVSAIISEFDDFLDQYEQNLDPEPCTQLQNETEAGTETISSHSEEEWKKFMDKGLNIPVKTNEDSTSSPDRGDASDKTSHPICNGHSGIKRENNDEKLGKRSRESVLVSQAFNFLTSFEKNSDQSACEETSKTLNGHFIEECENEILDVEKESVSDAEQTDNLDKVSEDEQVNHNQRAVSIAFSFIKELDVEENIKEVSHETNAALQSEAGSTDVVIRESRVISEAFNFLALENFENDVEKKKLSTVQECDDEVPQTAEPTTTPVNPEEGESSPVQIRQKSSISEQTEGASESEDDDVHVMPGAWRNSRFAYIGDICDTASESSVSLSPHTSPGAVRHRPLTIYPPDLEPNHRTSNNTKEENIRQRQFFGSTTTIGSTSTLIDRMDSGSNGRSEDEEGALNQSNDSDVFDSVESEINDENKYKKEKTHLKKGKKHFTHKRQDSTSTTTSEKEYRANYRSLQRTRILRNPTIGRADNVARPISHEVSREVIIELNDDETEFGFHIWGSRPVIVSTVKAGCAAERCGLQAGDVLVTINNINIIESSPTEVVELKGGSRRVVLGIGQDNLASEIPICCGYLCKQGGNLLIKNWRKRWVELKPDHCMYYYKNKGDVDPLGAVPLTNYTVTKAPEVNQDHVFKLTKYNAKTYYFSAKTEMEMSKWADAISQAAHSKQKSETWLDISSHNVGLPALAIRHADCHGYLNKMGNGTRAWRRRYCVLKDACLYYYMNVNSSTARGVAHFHGYSVQGSMPYNKRYGFMLLPPEPDMRTFYFQAENETEQKRWILSFQDSISKWIMVDE